MAQQPSFYVTTPIYYPSGKLHIGSSYTTIACDVLARYKRLMGYQVFYVTGLDEHGQKIENKAKEDGITPQAYVDGMAEGVKKLWKLLDISYDHFIRTTDSYHEEVVAQVFERLLAQDDIYLGEYAGWYSVPDEEFFTESQLDEVFRDETGKVIGGIAPSGHEVVWVSEESYFLRLSKYADRLMAYYKAHPEFIQPDGRMNEIVKSFLEPGLEDLAVSRTSFSWGIPVPSNPKHVIYVWIDALLNYITALGYGQEDDRHFQTFWQGEVLHMVGKDILRFHAIYWPIILMMLDIDLPDRLIAHGWFVMKDGKMSKSKGNVVYPEILVERFGLDPLRYYLMRSLPVGSDGTFTPEDYVGRINYELANDLGNLLNRTVAMMNQYLDGTIPEWTSGQTAVDTELESVASETIATYHEKLAAVDFSGALESVWHLIARTNKYIDDTTPWLLAKDDTQKDVLKDVMVHLAASLRVIAHLLQPFMMATSDAIMEQLGLDAVTSLEGLDMAGIKTGGQVVKKGTPIYPRLDMEAEIAYIKDQMGSGSKSDDRDPSQIDLLNRKDDIAFDDCDKLDIRVAEIKDVHKVKGSEKLLCFRVDAGDKEDRQILSGIAKYYPDEKQLVGKKVQIVANLKPRKMMGLISQGMILSAEHGDDLTLLTVDESIPNGSQIG